MVDIKDKQAIFSQIARDTDDVELEWDGTFADLHRIYDANEYLIPIFDKYGTTDQEKIDACNEVIEWLDVQFASRVK
jgi:hypothetical protein